MGERVALNGRRNKYIVFPCKSYATWIYTFPLILCKLSVFSGGREMVDVALHLVVNQLSEDIFVLPSPLCVLFKALEENCASRGVKTPHNCTGIKVCTM